MISLSKMSALGRSMAVAPAPAPRVGRDTAITGDKRTLRAAEYRLRADEATALAEASVLAHVREKHEMAAIRWRTLAEMDAPAADATIAA